MIHCFATNHKSPDPSTLDPSTLKGEPPTAAEYLEIVSGKITPDMTESVYKYLNFDQVTKEELSAMVG